MYKLNLQNKIYTVKHTIFVKNKNLIGQSLLNNLNKILTKKLNTIFEIFYCL